jgi:hypothetical protein
MILIAYSMIENVMRRSLVGARATDPVLPDRSRRR